MSAPREVIKTVRSRRYRYRVERVRDDASGKMRARWTYLGPADEAAPEARIARPPSDARERLLAALARLLEEEGAQLPSAGAIARAAGVAHGTFYRYFPSKEAALDALLGETRDALAELRPDSDRPPASAAAARAEVARWTSAICERARRQPGLVRASLHRMATDADRRTEAGARRARSVALLAAYLAMLDRAGFAHVPDPDILAAGLVLLLEAAFRSGADASTRPAETVSGAAAVIDRAIFGKPD